MPKNEDVYGFVLCRLLKDDCVIYCADDPTREFSKWHQAAWASRFCLHYRIAGCSCPRKIGKFYCLTLCVLCATQTSFLQPTPYGTSMHFMGVALAMSTTMAHVLMPKITSCCKTGALAEYILACGVQHEMCRDVPGLKAKNALCMLGNHPMAEGGKILNKTTQKDA